MNDWTIGRRQRRTNLIELAPELGAGTDLVAGVEAGDGAVAALVDREVALSGWMPTLRLLVLRRAFWAGLLVAAGVIRLEHFLVLVVGR